MAAHSSFAAGIAVLVSLAFPATGAAQEVQRTHGPDPAPAASPVAPFASTAADGDWCGDDVAGAHQLNNGEYRYHAVYAHPSDRPSRLAGLGDTLQQDAFGASALLEREYGRAIRFDVGTACGPAQLDISQVRLPFTDAQLQALAAAGGTATFDAVAAALRVHGFAVAANDTDATQLAPLRENFLVWLDGPAPARSCGQGTALLDSSRSETNLNNLGGKLAVIFRNGRDFCGEDVIRHEIGHNLGALQPDAPNTTDGVHCDDAFEDTMCAWEAPKLVGGPFNGLYFDYGNDDYWDPPQGAPLGWWTVNLSRFICPDANCNRPPKAAETRARTASDRRIPTLRHPRKRAGRHHRKPRARSGWKKGPRPARFGTR
jgi:hypothetical protein